VPGDRIGEADREAVPYAFAVGRPQIGALPDFGALAVVRPACPGDRPDAELQRARAGEPDLALELDSAGALLEIVAIIEPAERREAGPLEVVEQRLPPCALLDGRVGKGSWFGHGRNDPLQLAATLVTSDVMAGVDPPLGSLRQVRTGGKIV